MNEPQDAMLTMAKKLEDAQQRIIRLEKELLFTQDCLHRGKGIG